MAFVCEMCGNDNVVKQGGVFVCQDCGTKYSAEDVKQSMNRVTVDVSGSTVKVDSTDKLNRLYQLARRAVETNNHDSAKEYYNAILLEDPDSWEATLYSAYYNVLDKPLRELGLVAQNMEKSVEYVIAQIRERELLTDYADRIMTVINVCENFSVFICNEAYRYLMQQRNDHNEHVTVDILEAEDSNYTNSIFTAARVMYTIGDCIEAYFSDEEHLCSIKTTVAWHCGNNLLEKSYLPGKEEKELANQWISTYSEKIRQYDSSYETPKMDTGWCYVATCVYGSYDCPQVWTLRRFRDNTLARSLPGRGFIRLYYAVSPTIVRWFGQTRWFQTLWRGVLDRMVCRLNASGVESAPYQDRSW